MEMKETSYGVLIVSSSENFNNSFGQLLSRSKHQPVRIAKDVGMAKRILAEKRFDLVVINSPLPDEAGIRFAIDACGWDSVAVLFLVRQEIYEATRDELTRHGVYTLAKPTSRQILTQALSWLECARERLRKLGKKTLSMEEKMQEIRLVNRAKWLLISELKLSEENAHKYIEKQAMDQCVPKKEIAETIIRTYG